MKLEIQPQIQTEVPEDEQDNLIGVSENNENTDDFLDMLNGFGFLNDKENFKVDKTQYLEKTNEVYTQLVNFFQSKGGKYEEDVNVIYSRYGQANSPLIVRRENPMALMNMLQGKEIKMFFDPEIIDNRGDRYANSALWPYGPTDKMSGLANAFLEGRGKAGPLVMVIGVKNNPMNLEITIPEGALQEIGDIQRYGVRALSGSIKREDLQFIILRAPSAFIDESNFTDSEKERAASGKLQQIFRGFSFS